MSKFYEWQSSKQKLESAKNWSNNKNKVDSQSGFRYKKVVHITPSTFQYCGQAYCGANNYHECDESLTPYLQKVLLNDMNDIIKRAVDLMQEDSDKLAVQAKEEVDSMKSEIDSLLQGEIK